MSKSTTKTFKKNLLTTALTLATATSTHAGIVRGDVDYQYFRDFAENKGKFGLNATNVPIVDKNGNSVGTMLQDIPMLDLAVGSRGDGIATLVDPQYVVSVQHNVGYQNIQFGDHSDANLDSHHFDYQVTDRHLKAPGVAIGSWHRDDYHSPRLHKLVTEVSPIAIADETSIHAYLNKEKYPTFVRSGGGTQRVLEQGNIEQDVANPYQFVTGGSMLDLIEVVPDSATNIPGESKNSLMRIKGFDDIYNHPLGIMQRRGDSGSGVFAWDNEAKRWVYAMSVQSSTPSNSFSIAHLGFMEENRKQAIAGEIIANAKHLTWTPSGNSSTLTDGDITLNVGLADPDLLERDGAKNAQGVAINQWHRPRQNAGKTFTITGDDNVLTLTNSINQGAGAIYFKGNTSVEGANNDTTWLGAGVSIDKDKTLTWKVNNPLNDRLSKIGEGTMIVQGMGKNLGSISIGDGKVILDQRADSNGQKQAFDEVGIVSGRPTVVLNSSDQIVADNIYFGFRGGRLDVNGNDVTFNRIQNADSGANIVNHNMTDSAKITLNRTKNFSSAGDVPFETNRRNTHTPIGFYGADRADGTTDYFVLKEGRTPNVTFPTGKTDGRSWTYLATGTKQDAIRAFLALKKDAPLIARKDTFSGMLGEADDSKNGRLDIEYNPTLKDDVYMLNGGANLNGILTVKNGTLLLSGTPTPHAYDYLTNQEVIYDNDWIDREFKATAFEVTNSTLKTGRNVAKITGDINISGTGIAHIGYVTGDEVLTRTRTGATVGEQKSYNNEVLNSILGKTQVNGNISLRDTAELRLNTQFNHNIHATTDTNIRLEKQAHWIMPQSQTIGHLDGDNGQITLNARNQETVQTGENYNTLTIKGNLDGYLKFNYLSDLSNKKSDKLVVEGYATGSHTLAVKNTGNEANIDKLTLVELKHHVQNADDVSFHLANGYVDAGAYRYTLKHDAGKTYYLTNPKRADELARQRAEEAKKAEEEANKTKQALADAQKARQDAEEAKQRAEDALKTAQTGSGITPEQFAEVQKLANDAQKLAEQAQTQKAQTEQELATTRTQLINTQTAKAEADRLKTEAENQAQTAKAEQSRLQQALDNANRARQTAEAQKTSAENARQTAEQQATIANLAKETAEARLRDAKNKQQEAENQRNTAQTALTKANQQKKELEQQLATALATSNADTASLHKQLAEATTQIAEKEQALAQANIAKNQAESQKAEADRQITEAQTALTQAKIALANANEQREQAYAQIRQAETQRQTMAQNLSDIQAQLTQAQNDKKTAEQQLQEAEKAKNQVEQAKIRLEHAQTNQNEALKHAQDALQKAELAKQQADTARDKALNDLANANIAKNQAEEAKAEADIAKTLADTARDNAQKAQKLAEEAKNTAETARQKAEEANAVLEEANKRLQATVNADANTIAQAKKDLATAQKLADERQAILLLAQTNLNNANDELVKVRQENDVIANQLQQEKTLRTKAEVAQAEALLAKDQADKARLEAIDAQTKSEAERQQAEVKLAQAEALAKQKQTEADNAETARLVLVGELSESLTKLKDKEADLIVAQTKAQEAEARQKVAEAELAHLKAEEAKRQAEELAKQANQKKQSEIISKYANTALSEVSAVAHHLHRINDRIDERLQRLDTKNSGFWLQTDTEKSTHSSDQYRGFKQNSQLTQIGMDNTVEFGTGDLTLGASLNHLHYSAYFEDDFTVDGKTFSGSLYGKWQHENGFAITSDFTTGQSISEFQQHGRNTDIKRNIGSVGIGIAKSFDIGDIDVLVHTGVKHHYLGEVDYAITAIDNNQVNVKQDNINIISYQTGANLGKTIETTNGFSIRPNMGINYRYTNSESKVAVNDQLLTQKFANELQGQLGVTIGKDNWDINIQADFANNNEAGHRSSAMLGVNWKW